MNLVGTADRTWTSARLDKATMLHGSMEVGSAQNGHRTVAAGLWLSVTAASRPTGKLSLAHV
jgi:hypothetical protein